MDFGGVSSKLIAAAAAIAIPLAFLTAFCLYQLYFHPLSKYPGPVLAKITNLYSAWHAWRGDIHVDMWRCHQEYGDVVRYAPNRLMFYNPDAAKDIYGNRNNVTKSKVYNTLVHRAGNTLTIRNKAEHARRRRIMGQGFSDASLKTLEPKILGQVKRLLDVLMPDPESKSDWSEARNMATWCDRHTFDLMSTLIYSASYDSLSNEKFRHIPGAIEKSNIRMSVILQAPELMFRRVDKKIFPHSIRARNTFLEFVGSVIASRTKTMTEHKADIFSFFQHAVDPETGNGFGTKELLAESATLIVAGSDTTSITMAGVLHYLSRNSEAYSRAAAEVRTTFNSADEIRIGTKLASCTYLRACIEETLRMSPPTGSALWREVSTGGANIGGHFIPEGYDVGVGIYAIHHNPAFHSDPFVFQPERFLDEGVDMSRSRASREAFMPFSFGTRGCIGKGLAMAELMLTLSTILWLTDFRADASDEAMGEYQLRDHITGAKKGPVLQFRARNST